MNKLKMRFFDFEVTPNWWLCVFGDLPEPFDDVTREIKNTFVSVNSDMPDARQKLLDLLREPGYVQIGYNVKGYDLAIANCVYQGFTPEQIKIVSDIIVNPGLTYSSKEHIRLSPFAKKKLPNICFQDLMDDGAGSLKEKEATLGLNVLESSVDFNKEDLTPEDKADLDYYCRQDVYASMAFYMRVVHPYTLTKLHMGEHFNIPMDTCYKSTNARLVSIALNGKRKTFSDSDNVTIELPEKIKKYCYDNLPYNVVERVRTNPERFEIELFENIVSFGNGGIHSTYKGKWNKCPALYIESNDEWVVVNVDATSYYPSEMIQFNLLSRAIEEPQRFIDIYNERIAIKHKEHKTPEDMAAQLADKLVLNTTFGAAGNKFLDLYDPYMCRAVCAVGQIFLGALANKIYKTINNVKIIQCNTDGICCYLPKKELDNLQILMDEWTEVSGINMERDDILRIWQRDVNNYLAELIDKGKIKVKNKGGWLNDDYLRPGYVTTASANAFVCAKAVQKYLLYGEDVVENIVNNTFLNDFTITCTKGPTFSYVVQKMSDGTEVKLYKANRVVATKNKNYGMIYKIKKYKDKLSYNQMPSIPEHCLLVNKDLEDYDFNEIKKELDYMYYIERCSDMLNIQWVELKGSEEIITNKFDYFNQ